MNDRIWNDETRDALFRTLQWFVLGELRLAKYGREEILDACREVYIEDECPENERATYLQFAADELDRATVRHQSEMAAWPKETDCDRLDRVETALRDRGIMLWQASPCCDTCTGGELPDRLDRLNVRFPGFGDRARGYAFFIDQNMPEMLSDDTQLTVYLAYGWFSPDNAEVAREEYQANALGIAREVCECLNDGGFLTNWDGSISKKIGISLNWQRRAQLE